jgi:hypothetical protein
LRKNLVRLKEARNLIIRKGIDEIRCNCGFTPIIEDLSLGNVIYIGIQLLIHLVENPQCQKKKN